MLAEHAEEIAADPACRMRYYRKAGVDPAAAPFVLRTIRAGLRQRRELSGSRIRPDPCAPDAPAQDVSGINGNGTASGADTRPCFSAQNVLRSRVFLLTSVQMFRNIISSME